MTEKQKNYMVALVIERQDEKPVFCEAKRHPKNKNLKLDICPIIKIVFEERNEELELHNKNRRRSQKIIMNTQSYRCQ